MASDVLIKREGSIIVATLNRPEKLNAFDKGVYEGLKSLIDVLETDKTARVLVLTATGEKAFCVGADLKERQAMTHKEILSRLDNVKRLYHRMERLPVPIIAALNGGAFGGGLELALACDLRVVVETASVGLPEVDLAIIPGNGGTQRLSRVVGLSKALELILLAKKITAKEAESIGLMHATVPASALMPTAMGWANKILEAGPIGIRQAKLAVRGGFERSWEHALDYEIECYKACLYSKDRLEGVKAFIEKRKPMYTGE